VIKEQSKPRLLWEWDGETPRPEAVDWRHTGLAEREMGTRVKLPPREGRRVRALERIAAALERLAPDRLGFMRGPFEVTSDYVVIDDDSTQWSWTT